MYKVGDKYSDPYGEGIIVIVSDDGISGIVAMEQDAPSNMKIGAAEEYVESLSKHSIWRLPTGQELLKIRSEFYLKGTGNFHRANYWTKEGHYMQFRNGKCYNPSSGTLVCQVRAVRTFDRE